MLPSSALPEVHSLLTMEHHRALMSKNEGEEEEEEEEAGTTR